MQPRIQDRIKPIGTALLAGLAATLAPLGCAPRDLNARPTLGGSAGHNTLAAGTPTGHITELTRSLDRDTWTTTVFLVPVDGTVHGPTYRFQRTDTESPRGLGLHPTPESAAALQSSSVADEASSALLAPVGALAEFALMPIELIVTPPPSKHQSPGRVYKRTLQGGWSTGPAREPNRQPVPSGETAGAAGAAGEAARVEETTP